MKNDLRIISFLLIGFSRLEGRNSYETDLGPILASVVNNFVLAVFGILVEISKRIVKT